MRWLTNIYDFSFKGRATAAIGIHPTKAWLSQMANFKNAIWTWRHFRRTICNKILFWTWKKCRRNEWNASDCFWKAQSQWGIMRGVGGVRKSEHQSWLAKRLGLGLGLLCCSFKGIHEEIPSEEASTLQIGSVAFSPVHNSILVTDYLTKMGIKTVRHPPYSPDLACCDILLFLISEAVIMRQLRRWKRLWRRSLTRSHKRTSMGRSRSCWNGTTSALQPEEITSKGTRISCV